MISLDQEIAALATEFDSYRIGGSKKINLPEDAKRKAAALYHRKGKMTLLDLSRGLRVSPGAVRHWSNEFKAERRPRSELVPLRVVDRGRGVGSVAALAPGSITLSFRDLVITISATTDPGLVVSLIDSLLERAAC